MFPDQCMGFSYHQRKGGGGVKRECLGYINKAFIPLSSGIWKIPIPFLFFLVYGKFSSLYFLGCELVSLLICLLMEGFLFSLFEA